MSITYENGVFALDTRCTSYIFRVTKFRHLEHIHYGEHVAVSDAQPLASKHDIQLGSSVMYDPSDDNYCLDNLCLEWSGVGRLCMGTQPETISWLTYKKSEEKLPSGIFASTGVWR